VKFGISAFSLMRASAPERSRPLSSNVGSIPFVSLSTAHSGRAEGAGSGDGQVPREYHRTLDPFVALATAAAITGSLRLTTGILLLPQRDVIYTAKEIASLDLVSGGRLDVGVGVGWNRDEMRNHGPTPATRGGQVERAAGRAQTNLDPGRG
jgi:alkanesulfonate monooxygenase SsuD/methylene tetrahydromethanopterin reductase-like flavin-dependent oxidoreductase (luciferase family)